MIKKIIVKFVQSVKDKSIDLLFDQDLRTEHPIRYHFAKALASFVGLGVFPPNYQKTLATKLNLPENTFTLFGSSYGALFGALSYGAMYFGIAETSDAINTVAEFVETVPIDKVILYYGSFFVGGQILRFGVSAVSKEPQYPYSPGGVMTALGILGVGKGLEKIVHNEN